MLDPKKIKDWADAGSAVGGLVLKVVIGAGVLVSYIYCAFAAHFFPTGVAIGDSILFVFVALTFGLFYSILIGAGYYAWFGIFWSKSKKFGGTLKWKDKWPVFATAALIWLAMGGATIWDLVHSVKVEGLAAQSPLARVLMSSLLSGLALMLATVLWPSLEDKGLPQKEGGASTGELQKSGSRNPGRFVFLAAGLLGPALFGGGELVQLSSGSISVLGLSSERATLIVDEKNFRTIESAARLLRVPVLSCGIEGTDQAIVHDMRVLWHGVGERSEVAFVLPTGNGRGIQLAKLELAREGLKVLNVDASARAYIAANHFDAGSFEACLTLQSDALFDTYSNQPNATGHAQLQELQNEWKKYLAIANLKIVGAVITGYTDRRPVEKPHDSNEELSGRRAQSVRDALSDLLDGVPDQKRIVVSGLGSMRPKSHCSETLAGSELTECLAEDRRVEIRLTIEAPADQK